MDYILAKVDGKYRGMGRTLANFYTSRTKKDYNKILEEWFEVIECELNGTSEQLLDKLSSFYSTLAKYDIPCEIIAFDEKAIEEDFPYSVEFLGFDIVHDMAESLLEGKINPAVTHLLNENGLCRTEEDVKKVIPYQDHGGLEWKPCYVYKLLEFNIKKFDDFCNRYHFTFPQEFVEYLRKHNDAELEPNVVDIGDNECGIRYFYGTSDAEYCDIGAVYEVYRERMPEKCVPIADPDFGNQICMSLADDTYGRIYFWDQETMDVDDGDVCSMHIEDMKEIAASFNELLDNMKESPYHLEMEQKPSLLERFKQIFNL